MVLVINYVKIQPSAPVTAVVNLERAPIAKCPFDRGHYRRHSRIDLLFDPRLLVARHEVGDRPHIFFTSVTPIMAFHARLSCCSCFSVAANCTWHMCPTRASRREVP